MRGDSTWGDQEDCMMYRYEYNWSRIWVVLERLHTQLTDAGTKRKEKIQSRELATYICKVHDRVSMSNVRESSAEPHRTICYLSDMARALLRPLALVTEHQGIHPKTGQARGSSSTKTDRRKIEDKSHLKYGGETGA